MQKGKFVKLDESITFQIKVRFGTIRPKPGCDWQVSVPFSPNTDAIPNQLLSVVVKRARELVHEHLGWPIEEMKGWLGVGAVVVYMEAPTSNSR